MINLDNTLKHRAVALPTKICLVKAQVFPVVMYGCESWIIKKAEHQRIERHLLLGRKVMTNLDSLLKSRDITLPKKVHLIKAIAFESSCMDVTVGT